MSYQRISFIQPNRKYRPYRRTSFFRRRTFRFWTIKLTFVIFACKNQYFVVDWSRRVFTGEKVNWPAAYSWITLDSRYMAKISAAAYLLMRLISEYTRYIELKYLGLLENSSPRMVSQAGYRPAAASRWPEASRIVRDAGVRGACKRSKCQCDVTNSYCKPVVLKLFCTLTPN